MTQKRQKPNVRLGYDFEDAKTQRKTRSALKRQAQSRERASTKRELREEMRSI